MKIFISNSFKDSDIADLIKKKLLEFNFDIIQVAPSPQIGDNIAIQIERAIYESDAYIILLSKHFFDSKWSDLELMMIYDQTLGRNKGKRILPILLDKYVDIPLILKDIAYADFSDKRISKLDNLINDISKQLLLNEKIEYKNFKNRLREQAELLKFQELEYQLHKNKQKKIKSVFKWSFFMIAIISVITSLLLFTNKLDIEESFNFPISVHNITFYLLGFLTAIVPSLYLATKIKNKRNGK